MGTFPPHGKARLRARNGCRQLVQLSLSGASAMPQHPDNDASRGEEAGKWPAHPVDAAQLRWLDYH